MGGEKIWHTELTVVLIGWLDHCVEFEEDFDATILKTLEDYKTECNEEIYPFTPVQITNKLIELSRRSTVPQMYAPDYPRLREVKMKGSRCFPGLKPEIREKANIATRKYAVRRQKRQSRVDLVPKLPRHGDNGVENDDLANSRPNKDAQRKSRRSAGSYVTGHGQSSNLSSRKKIKATSHDRRTSESSLRVPSAKTYHNSLSICNFCGQVTSIEEINCSGLDSWENSWESTFENRASHTGQRLQIDGQKWEEVIQPLKDLVKQIINQNREEMRRLKGFHELEMTEVTRERDYLKQEHVRLTAQNWHFEVAHGKRKAAAEHDPLEGDLLLQYRVIANLQKQNAILERDIPYMKEVLLDQSKLLFTEAEATTLRMQSELESLFHLHEYQKLPAAGISSDSKLGGLLRTINREKYIGMHKNGETEIADGIGNKDMQLLLGHVVLTTVKQKVFDTSFPASGAQNFWWTLLREHQKIQMEFGGWQQLASYDRLAYKRIVENEEFKQLLSREATKHSNDLIEVLAPLFGLQLGDYHRVQGESPYTPDNLSKDIHYRLLEIFRAALRFKSLSVITRQKYEFAVHSEESVSQTENSYTSALSNQKPGDCDNYASNELWRIASLRIYAAGPRDHGNPFNDALVKVKNFLKLDSPEKRPEILHISYITCDMPDQDSKTSDPKNDCRAESEQEAGKHQEDLGCTEDGVAENEIPEISCQDYPPHACETIVSESTNLDSNLQERHDCKGGQKGHSSQWKLQHLDNNTCSQGEHCKTWSQSDAEHAEHWQECHDSPAKTTSSPIGESETRLSDRNGVHEQPRRGDYNQMPQMINRGVEGSTKIFSVTALSKEDPSMLSLANSTFTSTLQLATHSVTQPSRALVLKPANYGSTMKRAHDADRCAQDESSNSGESRKRRGLAQS